MTGADLANLQPGAVLDGKFRIERVLGEGGMGIVAKAYHLNLRRPVAIKFLRAEAALHHEAVQRFLREAQAASALQSEHVIRVFDINSDESNPYIVLEYLDGTDLESHLQTAGPLSVNTAVNVLLQAGEALAEAHARDIIHRDLKPSNLFLTTRADGSPFIKILDFGISKVKETSEGDFAAKLTSSMSLLGSPLYMSPEQLRGAKNADARSDLWSLAVVLYELLTGSPPFTGNSLAELMSQVLFEAVPPPSSFRPELPANIDKVLLGLLQKNPDDRPQNLSQFAQALRPWADAEATSYIDRIDRISQRSQGSKNVSSGLAATTRAQVQNLPKRSGVVGVAETAMTSVTSAESSLKSKNKMAWLLGSFAAMATLGAVVFVLLRPAPSPIISPVAARSSTTDAPLLPTASAAVPSAPERISLKLHTDPSNAIVELDGISTPDRVLDLPRSDQARNLVVSARGYVTEKRSFLPSSSLEISIKLQPEKPSTAAPTKNGKGKIEIKGPRERSL